MSVTVTLHPNFDRPPSAGRRVYDHLHGVVTILPGVDMLFGANDQASVAYLRGFAAVLTALADDIAADAQKILELDEFQP